ncbi:hypothetical protein BC829DRAFT_262374 [Chytridium lagenaria]|nr:hypothetical protein BC829DRAFT_262374 [Chytridium lagenaria]
MATPFQPNDDALQTIANTTFTADYAIVKFSRLNDLVDSLVFTLAPGASRRVFVHFDAPPNAIAGRFPVYSGYIAVAIAGGANHRVVATVPYAGMVGSWKDAPIWSRNSWVYTNRYLRPTWGTAANITASTGLYAARTFAPLRTAQPWSIVNATRGAFLLPIASTTSRYAMIEVLFAGNETQKAALPRALRHKSPLGYLIASRITTPTPLTVDPKAPAVFSQLSRNTPTASQGVEAPSAWLWNGEITTNSTTADRVIKLPAGRYQVRFSALKHFARLGAQSGGRNYDEVLSPVFELTF